MIPLSEAIASNEQIASVFPHGLVAVFVGGTSGVGEYTLKAFAKYVTKPRVYIIGRSQEAANRIVKECKELNQEGIFDFIKADVSLLKSVDDVCDQITNKEKKINILFQTQGTMAFGASKYYATFFTFRPGLSADSVSKATAEGLPLAGGLVMHSRLRFILNLLPSLQQAETLRRVISVGAATCEGPIDMSNIPGKDLPLRKWRDQLASIQTLLLEEASRRAPNVGFIHTVPGVVKSGITRDAEGLKMKMLIAVTSLLGPLIQTSPDECAERHVFFATSGMYPSSQGGAALAGIPISQNLSLARGTNGQPGSGMYSLDNKSASAPPRVEQLLAQFREDGTAKKVWEYAMADFKRITGAEISL
jgi:NAD(P)-dependent dehydrogenase (short-subunit alcohol dehydrogenase family)